MAGRALGAGTLIFLPDSPLRRAYLLCGLLQSSPTAAMTTEDRATFILGQINAGLRTEWSQIEGLEASLQHLLQEPKARAAQHTPAKKRSEWDKKWAVVQQHLDPIRPHAAEARR